MQRCIWRVCSPFGCSKYFMKCLAYSLLEVLLTDKEVCFQRKQRRLPSVWLCGSATWILSICDVQWGYWGCYPPSSSHVSPQHLTEKPAGVPVIRPVASHWACPPAIIVTIWVILEDRICGMEELLFSFLHKYQTSECYMTDDWGRCLMSEGF